MSDETHRLESLFEAAIAIDSAEERDAFLRKACGDDHRLHDRVERGLESDEQAGGFLETPPAELDGSVLGASAAKDLTASLDAALAPAFGEGAAHSVLDALGHTIDVPRVALRESAGDSGSITRPGSPQIPKSEPNSR